MARPDLLTLKAGMTAMVIQFSVRFTLTSYSACVAALTERRGDVERLTRERFDLGPNDPFPASQYVDGYGWSPDAFEDLIDLEQEIEASLAHVRLAFMATLYHAFEKQVLAISPPMPYRAKFLPWALDQLAGRGVRVDAERLDHLRLAVNAHKHGPKSGDFSKLKNVRPDLVQADEVVISHNQLKVFFDAVLAVAPVQS